MFYSCGWDIVPWGGTMSWCLLWKWQKMKSGFPLSGQKTAAAVVA